MITLHSLAYSRALRAVWLLEALDVPYDLKTYSRTEAYRAPPELKALHPLGKSPVLIDGDLTLAESASILRYLHARYGDGRFAPAGAGAEAARHEEWLDYAEGSFAGPLIATFRATKAGTSVDERNAGELRTHLDYLSTALDGRAFLMGEAVTLADMQLSYLLAMAQALGALDERADLAAYFERLHAQPALQSAIAKAGPMMPGRLA